MKDLLPCPIEDLVADDIAKEMVMPVVYEKAGPDSAEKVGVAFFEGKQPIYLLPSPNSQAATETVNGLWRLIAAGIKQAVERIRQYEQTTQVAKAPGEAPAVGDSNSCGMAGATGQNDGSHVTVGSERG